MPGTATRISRPLTRTMVEKSKLELCMSPLGRKHYRNLSDMGSGDPSCQNPSGHNTASAVGGVITFMENIWKLLTSMASTKKSLEMDFSSCKNGNK